MRLPPRFCNGEKLEDLPAIPEGARWPAAAAIVIVLLARAAKEPAVGSPFARVPVRWRPHVVLALGMLSGILDAAARGTPWGEAIAGGILSAALAVLIHGVAGGVNPQPLPDATTSTTADTLPPAADTLAMAPLDLTPEAHGGGPLVEQHVGGFWGPRPSDR